MARIALIKLFTGLNLAPAQLSGELQRAGHDSLIVYFKDYRVEDYEDSHKYAVADHAGIIIDPQGRKKLWSCYQPFSQRDFDNLLGVLRDFRPDAIGFSTISGTIRETALVTAEVKRHFDVPIIWGGPGPTLEPERCIELTDLICINEGEEVIVDLANRVDAGEDITTIAGTHARLPDGSVRKNPQRPMLELNDIAFPDWNLQRYVHIGHLKGARIGRYPHNLKDEYPIMTQRGCPFSCSFCIESRYQDMFGKKNSLRRRKVELVMEELHWAKNNLDINTILFYDDVFTVNPRWLKEFLPRYKTEIGLPFWCYTYPTTHDRALLEQLRDAGMTSVTMGIQSGSEHVLREYLNRPTSRQRVLEAAQEIVDLGSSVRGFFDLITNIPFETEEDLRQGLEFMLELPVGLRTLGFAEMTNFPTYGFTELVAQQQDVISRNQEQVTPELHDFYNRLYLLTRTDMPRDEIRRLSQSKQYRNNPDLLLPLITNEQYASFTGISF